MVEDITYNRVTHTTDLKISVIALATAHSTQNRQLHIQLAFICTEYVCVNQTGDEYTSNAAEQLCTDMNAVSELRDSIHTGSSMSETIKS